ncbi:MAG TPA: phosphatase PAP2 family protein [Tepidisphaeraceae bacterium]|nr:phosphatase PAP2 family protein [Tepidisphaeraceae bacterium]
MSPSRADDTGSPGSSRRRIVLVVAIWAVAIVAGAFVDRSVAAWVHGQGLDGTIRGQWYAQIIKVPGTYWPAVVLAGVLWVVHPLNWQAAGFMCLSGLTGLVAAICKWGVGRTRPFRLPGDIPQPAPFELTPFRDGLLGVFHQSNLAFPSGHACTAFATAAALAMLLPGWRWGFYAVATLVAVERVAENAHYVSDVIAGAAFGILGVRLIAWICDRLMKKSNAPAATMSAEECAH